MTREVVKLLKNDFFLQDTLFQIKWYTVPGMLHLFMHLILMANFKEGMWRDYFSIPLIIILRE